MTASRILAVGVNQRLTPPASPSLSVYHFPWRLQEASAVADRYGTKLPGPGTGQVTKVYKTG